MTITNFERNASIAEMAVEIDRRGAVIEKLEARLAHIDGIYRGAIDNLNHNQRQLDMDGVEVGVSRQALCEVLIGVEAALSAALPLAASPAPSADTSRIAASVHSMIAEWYAGTAGKHIPVEILEKRLSRFLTASPARGEVAVKALPDNLRARIHSILCDYRMTNFVESDDHQSGYSLVDLCTPDGQGIDKGEDELFLIADEIAAALASAEPAPATGGKAE